jgi:hypothetical protein
MPHAPAVLRRMKFADFTALSGDPLAAAPTGKAHSDADAVPWGTKRAPCVRGDERDQSLASAHGRRCFPGGVSQEAEPHLRRSCAQRRDAAS